MTQRVFTDFSERHKSLFGRHSIDLTHSLANSNLFTDAALADLIERTPAGSYHVNTMDVTTQDPRTRREGVVDGLSGSQALEAVRRGNISIQLHNPGRHDPRYEALLTSVYTELAALMPDFKCYSQKLSILISSPRVQFHYRAGISGETLWQVRGHKRVFIYPNSAPFLPQQALERIVNGAPHDVPLDYERWFDDYAEVIDLAPGRMLHWPLNCPHRIVNADGLSVSFTTEHWTGDLHASHAVNYANGILRSRLGFRNLARPTSGPGLWSRLGLAAACKAAGINKPRHRSCKIEFKVDLDAPGSVRSIPPFDLSR